MNMLELLGIRDPERLIPLTPINTNAGSGLIGYSYIGMAGGSPVITATLIFREGHRKFSLSDARRVDVQLNRQHPEPPKCRKQSFYFNGEEPIYTLMEAYNLLEGRSVLKVHTDKKGNERRSWFKINFARQHSMGNYAYEYFHAAPFDVRGLLVERFDMENRAPEFIEELVSLLESGYVALVAVPEKFGTSLFSVGTIPESCHLKIEKIGFEPSVNILRN